MENLLQTGFKRRFLRKLVSGNSYCYKKISWSWQLFQETEIVWDIAYLRAIDSKLILNLIVIFNSFIDISLLKYVTKHFCISYYFQEKTWECFKVQLSDVVSVYILSSKRTKLVASTLYKDFVKYPRKLYYWRCSPQMWSQQFFSWFVKVFRTTAKKLVLEYYILAYHTDDKDHAKIL